MKQQLRWRKLIVQTTLWLVAEVLLTSIGTDDLADYSEFHFTYRDETTDRIEKVSAMHHWLAPMM
jgi:hypothetical protein